MKLTCKKCQTRIEIPPDATQVPDARVVCPGCRTRYRLRPRKKTAAAHTEAPAPPAANASPVAPPAAAAPSAAPPPVDSSSAAPPSAAPPSVAPSSATAGWTPATPVSLGGPGGMPLVASGSAVDHDQPTAIVTRPAVRGLPVFSDGETIAGRYRILRYLAQGGMGEVYEAEDLELRQKVALKTISAQIGDADPAAIERFKREIALARSVTHPNVCRIFDLGRHRPETAAGETPAPAVTFLSMELLEGETLSRSLRRRGRLSTLEALPLITQMADALGAAHRAQIVHRDFKSENVFLVPVDGTAGASLADRRVVVTDFGVARGGAGDNFAAQVTGTGIVGTPSYMAPEQVEGGPITAAADIYALGIVIYEMVTGRLPFQGPNPLSTAVKRLNEAPPPPHVHVPDLEAWWEKAILRCLERDPQKRFQTAAELVEALQPPVRRPPVRPTAKPTSAVPRPTAPRAAAPSARVETAGMAAAAAEPAASRRVPLLGMLLILVSVASAGLYYLNRDRELDRSRVAPRRSIAVLGLRNSSGLEDAAWLGTAVAEMLTTELARGETLRTISGELVAQAHRQLTAGGEGAAAATSASLESNALERLRALLGCDFVISGSYVTLGEAAAREVRLDLRLHDAALGNTVASVARNGPQGELFRLVSELGDELRDHLGVDDAGGGDDPLSGLPSDPQAARLYAQALDQLRASRPHDARQLLQQAALQAPRNALVQSALSQAWQAEGYGERAAEAAERAFELSSPLPREDRLAVEGRYREATGDWPAAIEVYGKLCDYFPDDLDYGLKLATAQIAARDAHAAIKTLDGLRQLPAPISEDPRIDLAEAAAAGLTSDFSRQLEAARRAGERATAIDATLSVAEARLTEARVQRLLGRLEEAEQAAGEAVDLYRELEHAGGSAEAMTALANVDFDRGDFDAAAERYRQVLDDYRSLGDQDGTASALNNLALVLRKRGDLDGAQALYEETAQIFEATGDELAMSFALNNLGVLLVARDRLAEAGDMFERSKSVWQQLGNKSGLAYSLHNAAAVRHLSGDLEQGRELNQQALEIRRQTGEKAGEATSLTNLADVLRDLGELDQAEDLLRRALELTEEIGDRSTRAQALYVLGRLRLDRGDFEPARAALQEALDLRRDLDERREVTDARIALARLALLDGDAGGAEAASREAIEACRRDDRRSEEARATAVLALALLVRGELDSSRDAAEEALHLAESSEQPAVRYEAAIAEARVRAASDDPESALLALAQIEQDCQDAGYVTWALEARLAWAEAALAAGREDEARERLRAVVTGAGEHGLGRLVDRAGAL